jgi:pimeloyl-ACP methyl ester carboxylesterase
MGDNVHAAHGVLLVLSGGPGQPGLPILHGYVSRALSAERSQYRIVVFDQRGTGAGALDCKAMQHEMGSSDLTPPSARAVRACARKLGTRRQFFGTDDVVADITSGPSGGVAASTDGPRCERGSSSRRPTSRPSSEARPASELSEFPSGREPSSDSADRDSTPAASIVDLLRGKREEAPGLRDAFQLMLAAWLES